MTTPPADSPAPERPLPWWRNRRRLFYLAVVIVPLATLWGGWVWWYRADFPVPSETQCRAFGMDWASHEAWIIEPKEKLHWWKMSRETRRLRLAGTTWRDEASGVTLKFRNDGRLGVGGPTGWEDQLEQVIVTVVLALTERERSALADLHLTAYQFSSVMPPTLSTAHPPNLVFPDSAWDGFLWAMSQNEVDLILSPKPGNDELLRFRLRLTRVPAAP
jgi:hypothetical protein